MIPRLNNHKPHVVNCRRFDDEEIVQNGLAVTPSQMLELAQKGVPISPNNLGLGFEEGVSDLDFEPPLNYRRGVDLGDLFEAREDVKSKVKKAVSNPSNFENVA